MNKNKITKYIEDKTWRPSILKEIQENKWASIVPNSNMGIRKQREILEEIIIEEIIDLDELEEVEYDEDFEESNEEDSEDLEKFGIVEDKSEIMHNYIHDSYYYEFDFKLFVNWIQIGKYLIPENQFREILLQNKRIWKEFPRRENEIICLLKGVSAKDILLQKELLKVEYPVPIKITKQLESEIRNLNEKEKKTLGRMIKSCNLSEVDWNYMTVKKIEFLAKSELSFSREESRLSLKKLKNLKKEKIKEESQRIREEVKNGEWDFLFYEDPKEGCKFLDRIEYKINPFFYKKEEFILRTPKNYMELYNEGLRMRNCIAKLHLSKIVEDYEFPLFLERKGSIIAHLLLNSAGEIKEVRMEHNKNPDKRIEDFVDEFGEKFNLVLSYKKQYGYGKEGFKQPFD